MRTKVNVKVEIYTDSDYCNRTCDYHDIVNEGMEDSQGNKYFCELFRQYLREDKELFRQYLREDKTNHDYCSHVFRCNDCKRIVKG